MLEEAVTFSAFSETEGGGSPFTSSLTPEAAESIPYAELKQKLRAEAAQYREATTASLEETGEFPAGTEEVSDADTTKGTESVSEGADQATRSGETTGTSEKVVTPELLSRQVETMSANLKTLSDERKQLLEEVQRLREADTQRQQTSEQQRLQSQHEAVEARIATLSPQEQQVARAHYSNQLNQAALNDYARFLQTQQQEVAATELRLAVAQAPNILGEIADFVAKQQEIPADALKSVIASPQVQRLLSAVVTPEGYTAAMATVAEWLDFEASREASRVATEKEQRRKEAAASAKVQRDTPAGVNAAGGDTPLVDKINGMTREEFFAWKAQQLKQRPRRR